MHAARMRYGSRKRIGQRSGACEHGFGVGDGGDGVQIGAELVRLDRTEVTVVLEPSPIKTWIDGSVVALKRSSSTSTQRPCDSSV